MYRSECLHKRGKESDCSIHGNRTFAILDHSFDRVLMVDALHHVVNQAETICELYRVLKPGGRLVIEEPDLRNLLGQGDGGGGKTGADAQSFP